MICNGEGLSGIALIGGATICVGLAIYLLYGCKLATDGMIVFTKETALDTKKLFRKKEAIR